MATYTVKFSDNVEFYLLETQLLCCPSLLKLFGSEKTIKLDNYSANAFSQILKYFDNPENMDKIIESINGSLLMDTILLSDYLEIKEFKNQCCNKFKNMVNQYSPQTIRRLLN